MRFWMRITVWFFYFLCSWNGSVCVSQMSGCPKSRFKQNLNRKIPLFVYLCVCLSIFRAFLANFNQFETISVGFSWYFNYFRPISTVFFQFLIIFSFNPLEDTYFQKNETLNNTIFKFKNQWDGSRDAFYRVETHRASEDLPRGKKKEDA